MEQNKNLYSAITKIAWGYICILVNINIGSVNILPAFVGYILILDSLRLLKEKCKNIMLLRPLAIILIIWNIFTWLQTSFAIQSSTAIYIGFIIEIIQLYFNFQLITELSRLATEYQGEAQHIDKALLTRRNIYTAVTTTYYLLSVVPYLITANTNIFAIVDGLTSFLFIIGIVTLIVGFMLIYTIFGLRKLFSLRKLFASEDQETDSTQSREDNMQIISEAENDTSRPSENDNTPIE